MTIFKYIILLLGLHSSAIAGISLQKVNHKWWFIKDNEEKFVSIGVNHLEPHLFLAPYNKSNTLNKYGHDLITQSGQFNTKGEAAKRWLSQQIKTLTDLNFNSLGMHTHPSIDTDLYKDKMYYLKAINAAPIARWQWLKGLGPLPDVFSNQFERYLDKKIQKITHSHKHDSNLLGYVFNDVPFWRYTKRDLRENNNNVIIYPWAKDLIQRGASEAGKIEWIHLLKDRYKEPLLAAQVWGLPISPTYGITWEQIANQLDWNHPAKEKEAKADISLFMKKIAERWYKMHYTLIKKYDQDHLIFGDKSSTITIQDWLIESLKKYVDVICVQTYRKFEVEENFLDRLYKLTGKPILNGDGGHAHTAEQQKEYGVKGEWSKLGSQEAVANYYRETINNMFSKPYFIGWHHCGFIQQWDQAERGDADPNENGFIDPFEQPIKVWTEIIQTSNARVNDIHELGK